MRREEDACGPKQRFLTAWTARRAAAGQRRLRRRRVGFRLHHYRCGFCGFWHVGGERRRRGLAPYDRARFRGRVRPDDPLL